MHLVQQLWIFTREGIALFNQQAGEFVDEDLFGSFISAIDGIVDAIGEEGCKTILMGSSKITIFRESQFDLYAVSRSDPKVKTSTIHSYLKKIIKKFVKYFKKELTNWNGNIYIFKDADKVINLKNDPENWFGFKMNNETCKSILDRL
ncbi:MAG: hypothetical protein ACTSRW_09105 [Candidatus Helarchaeota archaeon]